MSDVTTNDESAGRDPPASWAVRVLGRILAGALTLAALLEAGSVDEGTHESPGRFRQSQDETTDPPKAWPVGPLRLFAALVHKARLRTTIVPSCTDWHNWRFSMSSFKRSQRKYVKKAYRVRNWREYELGLR